ncbi:MAG TPA: phosphoribosylformylglycinamidine cyclo-ligase [Friedmanniella sp.]
MTPTQQGGRPPRTPAAAQSAYAAAGVDIDAGDRAVELMRSWVAKTRRPEVLGGLGGFAGFFDASALKGMDHPVLATSTDGVGTKVAIAQALGVHDTIGFDLVGMVVDDLVVCGAEPLFMTDYIACGTVVPERIAAIVKGIAEACAEAGCALVGGETAEHPGLLAPDEYDVAGAATGVVERDRILGPDRVRPGDVVLAMESSGLHSNGYSLVRHVLAGAGWSLDRHVDELGRTIGEELLVPTRIYSRDCLALIDAVEVHAMSHVTGGGLANNLARVVPTSCTVTVDRATWAPAPVFGLVRDLGHVSQADLEATLNLGVGMVALLPEASVARATELLAGRGLRAWVCGSVSASTDPAGARVELVGSSR